MWRWGARRHPPRRSGRWWCPWRGHWVRIVRWSPPPSDYSASGSRSPGAMEWEEDKCPLLMTLAVRTNEPNVDRCTFGGIATLRATMPSWILWQYLGMTVRKTTVPSLTRGRGKGEKKKTLCIGNNQNLTWSMILLLINLYSHTASVVDYTMAANKVNRIKNNSISASFMEGKKNQNK